MTAKELLEVYRAAGADDMNTDIATKLGSKLVDANTELFKARERIAELATFGEIGAGRSSGWNTN